MADRERDRIRNLPFSRRIADSLPLIQHIRQITGQAGEAGHTIAEQADAVLDQAGILDLPDRFNAAFASRGWIATASLKSDVMRQALAHHHAGDAEAAEAVLVDWLNPRTINILAINRTKQFNKVIGRWHQLREALALTEEGRYWSAVPLILIACDGFASDVLGHSPFKKGADLELFDSIVGHPTSLPHLIGLLTKGVRKSSDDPMPLPLRHGILHGQSLGYADRVVCAKAWMLLLALVDWAHDKSEEEVRRANDVAHEARTDAKVLAAIHEVRADREEIDRFQRRSFVPPFDGHLPIDEPPFAFQEFLEAWKAGKFGIMAARAVNLMQKTKGQLAKEMRSDVECSRLDAFDILSVEQTAIARAEATVRMEGRSLTKGVAGVFRVLAFRNSSDGQPAMPAVEGTWQVQAFCIYDLMNGKTIKKNR